MKRTRAKKGRKSTARKAAPTPKPRRGFAPYKLTPAQKGAITRARNRAARERAEAASRARRVQAGRKGVATRMARAHAAHALAEMQRAKAQDLKGHIAEELYDDWQDAKTELYEATDGDQDYERYLDILDEIADASGTEWAIAYGPQGVE